MRTLAVITWFALYPATALAELPVVQGASLADAKDLEPWVDRTFTVEDRFEGAAPEGVPAALRSLGFNDHDHVGLFLKDSRLVVFLARTEATEDLVKSLSRGDRISVTGVLRSERYKRPSTTEIVGDLDVTISYRERTTRAVDARKLWRGWSNDPPFLLQPPLEKDYAAAEGTLPPAAGARSRIRVPVEGIRFSRTFSLPESGAGLSLNNAVRITWGTPAVSACGERRMELLDALTAAEPGDQLELWLRAVPPSRKGDPPVVILDRVNVLARRQ